MVTLLVYVATSSGPARVMGLFGKGGNYLPGLGGAVRAYWFRSL